MINFHPSSPWDDASVADLRRLHAEGLSAKQIGIRIGVTKNAVIGKMGREGLSTPRIISNPIQVYAKLRANGVSIKDIAARFGITRNGLRSSLAKHRQAQEKGPTTRPRKRSSDASLARKLQRLKRPRKARPPQPWKPTPVPATESPNCVPVTLMDLAGIAELPGHCRWPLGEPAGALTLFCGSGRDDIASSYCEYHARLCYRPPEETKSRNLEGMARRYA